MSLLATPTPTNTILNEGELFKRGKVNQSWKKRWFVLNSNFELSYYESKKKYDNGMKNMLGKIDLLQVQKIQVSLIKGTELSSIPKYIQIISMSDNNNNHSKNNRSFLIYLTTPKRIYKLSANNNDAFLKWLQYFHTHLFEAVILESFLERKNDANKEFSKYYFVLNEHKHLKYYNNENRDMLRGIIDLNQPLFTLKLQTTNKSVELNPEIECKTKQKHVLYTKDENIFNKWSDNLRNKNYKNLMNDNNSLLIESDDEEEDINTLNLSGQNIEIIPLSLCRNISHSISKLILTNNKLSSLKQLKHFPNLTTLQLDRNQLKDINDLPKLSKLTTLWLNNNNLDNINSLLLILKQQCPNLEYLSLLFNPLCSAMNENDKAQNKRYRLTLIYHLPNLKFLDTLAVRSRERHQSLYGIDESIQEADDKGNEQILDSNLFRYKSENLWSTMSLEQHEEELTNQLMALVAQSNNMKSRLHE